MDNKYNGWTNRETRLVNVYYNPDSKQYVDSVKELIGEQFETLPDFFKDMFDISKINREELKEHCEEEEETTN